PVLVGGAQQERENVIALIEIGLGPAQRDLLVEEWVERGPRALEPRPGAPGAQIVAQVREQGDQVSALGELIHERNRAVEALTFPYSEDRPQDHLERDALRMRP